ncbi:hypothetical protein [Sediminibacter sp. Hel_I_10]|uniref:hypothetical protein n=1 Tax=Sediminibacter sp. Hel_I_10 TaxID=1392490 RepID=UPI00055DA335|nr:hypothetical protein [Sediminibacter sp. Hel_I_10]
MIITKDFVFIHMPKTGGTYVHGIFKKIIADFKRKHPIKWYVNRMGYRLDFLTPFYQKLNDVSYDEYPNDNTIGQHAGVSFIPKAYKDKPVISVKRNPINKFVSAYYFKWWERFPSLPLNQLKKLFPQFPEISIEEYFELSYNCEMKHFFKQDYRDDIGVLSWQFIRMYASDPLYVYKNISKENYLEIIKNYFVQVEFFEMEDLSPQFERYIKSTIFSEYSHYFKTEERIYPPGSNPKKRPEYISDLLKNKIKNKEWILYKFFPEYNL